MFGPFLNIKLILRQTLNKIKAIFLQNYQIVKLNEKIPSSLFSWIGYNSKCIRSATFHDHTRLLFVYGGYTQTIAEEVW